MKAAGLIFDNSPHYLDHLGPFCALQKCPLILSDPILSDTAKRFYPDLKIIEQEALEVNYLLKDQKISHLISCSPKPLLQTVLDPLQPETLWLPHGNSDKGRIAPWFDALRQETSLLVYGQKMIDFFKEGSLPGTFIPIGAFRKEYAEKQNQISLPIHFAKQQYTVLYAPTWEDSENNSSFWQALPELAKKLPSEINLLVKPHPNTIAKHAPSLERLIGRYEKDNLQFLLDFPPIFPLLKSCDAYLGDRSSIGYDFLLLDRPLFFLDPHINDKRGKDLQSCGITVASDTFYDILKKEDPMRLSKKRKAMAAYTFEKAKIDWPMEYT